MQTQKASVIKNYSDRESLEANVHHCTLFIHFLQEEIKTVMASKSRDAIYSLKIFESKTNDIFKTSVSELNNILDELEPLRTDIDKTKIIISNNRHTLVPEPLFAGDKAESYLKLNTGRIVNQKIIFNRIPKNRVSVFSVDNFFYSTIKTVFPQSEIIHETELLLALLNKISRNDENEKLFVQLHSDYFEIVHFKNNELNYLNTFRYESDTDIVYFLLSVSELLKLNQDDLCINLFGEVSNSSSLIGLLKKYIPKVELMKRSDSFSYPASFREFQEQQHYLPTGSLLCES